MTENTTPTENVELGTQLRQAREARNLSIEDVSKQINLRPAILTKLESNQFEHDHIPAAFVRGYLRSYLKFLKLPESLLDTSVLALGETPQNDLGKNTRISKAVNSHSSHSRWLSWITWLIVLIAIAMTVLWWWENHQKSNAERDNLVESYATSQIDADKNRENSTALSTPITPVNTSVNTENNANALPVTENLVPVNNDNTVQPEVVKNVVPQANVTEPPTVAVSQIIAQTDSAHPESAVQNTIDSESTTQDQGTAMTNAELRIEITGANCWLSVKDSKRKVLAQKEYKQGEVLTFNAGSPYSLIIGAPGNVKITYQGNDVPLKVDGRVAKFKLPKQ